MGRIQTRVTDGIVISGRSGSVLKGEAYMENCRFTELVEKENGLEFYQAFRDEVD